MYVQNSLITLLHTSSNDHIVIALAYLHSYSVCVSGAATQGSKVQWAAK
jgi:hypothetical protein